MCFHVSRQWVESSRWPPTFSRQTTGCNSDWGWDWFWSSLVLVIRQWVTQKWENVHINQIKRITENKQTNWFGTKAEVSSGKSQATQARLGWVREKCKSAPKTEQWQKTGCKQFKGEGFRSSVLLTWKKRASPYYLCLNCNVWVLIWILLPLKIWIGLCPLGATFIRLRLSCSCSQDNCPFAFAFPNVHWACVSNLVHRSFSLHTRVFSLNTQSHSDQNRTLLHPLGIFGLSTQQYMKLNKQCFVYWAQAEQKRPQSFMWHLAVGGWVALGWIM